MIKRLVNSIKDAWRRLERPPEGRVYRYDPNVDSHRATLTKNLTFSRLETILRNGDNGDITEAVQLFEEMECSDARTFSVAGTRRRRLIGLDYEIVSAAEKRKEGIDKNLADEAAVYVRERLDRIDSAKTTQVGCSTGPFEAMLTHLATGIGSNLAVVEQVWELGELVDLEPIPTWRLTMKPQESLDIRVITAEERTYGVPATSPKFVVHIPNGMSGSPIDRSLSRAQAIVWLFKHLALSDWGAFCELFGMPVRVGKYDPNVSDAEKRALKNMLENLGSRAWAMLSRGVDVDFVESSQRSAAPFEGFINWLNRETGVLFLGANLTSDTTGGTGTFAAASVQDDIRMALAAADIKAEATTIREQILAPMVAYKFPLADVPAPYFERREPDRQDVLQKVAQLRGVQQLGMPIGTDWAYESLGIKKPEAKDAVLEPPDAFAEGLSEGGGPAFGGEMLGLGAGGTEETTLNELTLGLERVKRAGDPELLAKLKEKLNRMLEGMK